MAYVAWSVVFGEQPSAAKWNILGTNDASFNDGTGIAASAITPEKLLTGTGTSWGWTSFTPSYTNLTVGSGTNTGYYKQIGKTVFFHTRFVYGSGSSVSGGVDLVPPIAVSSNYSTSGTFTPIGHVVVLDSGTANYTGIIRFSNRSGNIEADIHQVAGTYSVVNQVAATAPMTWTTNDELRISGVYEAA